MSLMKSLVRKVLALLPKNPNKILFESAPDLSDNARALYDYLCSAESAKRYRFVWCVEDPAKYRGNPHYPRTKFVSFRKKSSIPGYLWQIATTKTVFYTHATPPFLDCARQTVLCLWHGTPLKHMDYQATGVQPFTALLSSSDWCSEALADCFHIDRTMTDVCGYPRNDQLFAPDGSLARLGVEKAQYRKILLWAPTFRQSKQLAIEETAVTATGLPLLEQPDDLAAFDAMLQREGICCLLKLHPLQDLSAIGPLGCKNIVLLTNADLAAHDVQLYPLLAECDGLLTDYSSIYFDYLLLDRPIGFTVDDIGQYRVSRGFVCEDPESMMPGEKIRTVAELESFLHSLAANKDTYVLDRARVNALVNTYTDADSSKRICQRYLPNREDFA